MIRSPHQVALIRALINAVAALCLGVIVGAALIAVLVR